MITTDTSKPQAQSQLLPAPLSAESLWAQACAILVTRWTRSAYNTWIAPCKPLQYRDGQFILQVTSEEHGNILMETGWRTLISALQSVVGHDVDLVLCTVDGVTLGPTQTEEPALTGCPEWLTVLHNLCEPDARKDALLMAWARPYTQGHGSLLRDTAYALVQSKLDGAKKHQYKNVRRAFQNWVTARDRWNKERKIST